LELLELNKTLKAMLEGIQGIIGGIDDWRWNDVKILGVLQDIQSAMWYYMWKSPLETGSGTESVNGDGKLAELEKEKAEQAKKVLEMEVLDALFTMNEVSQMLQE